MDRELQRERALALFDEGRAAMTRLDLHVAVAKLEESVGLFPTVPSLEALGRSLFGLARDTDAIVHFAAALGLGGNGARLRTSLAEALVRSGDRSEGIRQLRAALQEEPDHEAAREDLKRLLMDPACIARTANRRRLLHELQIAVPNLPFGTDLPPAEALALLGRYVAHWVELGRAEEGLAPVFQFLYRLAVSPEQDVVDLLTGSIFPVFAERRATTELARRALVGRARSAFGEALALWGEPPAEPAPFAESDLLECLRFFVPKFEMKARWRLAEAAPGFGQYLTDLILAGGSDDQLGDGFLVVSRMATSEDPDMREAFARVLGEFLASRDAGVIATARRLLRGAAHHAFEHELGWE